MSRFSLGPGAGPLSTTGEDWAGRVAGPWGTMPQVPEYLEPTVVNCGHPCAWDTHPWPEASALDLNCLGILWALSVRLWAALFRFSGPSALQASWQILPL